MVAPLTQVEIGLESFFKADGAFWGPDQTWTHTAGSTVHNNHGACSNQLVGEFIKVPCTSLEADTTSVGLAWDLVDWAVDHASSEIGVWCNFYGATSGPPPGAGKGSIGGGWQIQAAGTPGPDNVMLLGGGVSAAGATADATPVEGSRVLVEAQALGAAYEVRVFIDAVLIDSQTFPDGAVDSAGNPAEMDGPLRFEMGIYRYNFSGSGTFIEIDGVVFGDLVIPHHATNPFAMRAS